MRISAKNLNLDIKAPLSKSVYHRELIVNFILGARGDYLNESPDDNDDIRATKSCLRALEEKDAETVILNCNESGSTLRFMIPVALAAKSDSKQREDLSTDRSKNCLTVLSLLALLSAKTRRITR